MSRFARLFGDTPPESSEHQPANRGKVATGSVAEMGQELAVQVRALDPRPDLADDHDMWEIILAEARARNRIIGHYIDADGTTRPVRLEELFHALRCMGVGVIIQQGPQGPRLKLSWEHVCAPEQDEDGQWVTWMRPEQFRRTYLEPYRDAIAEHLKHTWEVMRHAQLSQSTPAAAA